MKGFGFALGTSVILITAYTSIMQYRVTAYATQRYMQVVHARVPDAFFAHRVNESMYLSVQTNDPMMNRGNGFGSPLLFAEPHQHLYLFAFGPSEDIVGSKTKWIVDSPSAFIRPSAHVWYSFNHQEASAVFIANRPGIYTIQAEYGGRFSVPMVLEIGLSSLMLRRPSQISSPVSPLLPLPHKMAKVPADYAANRTIVYDPYPITARGYIPIRGILKDSHHHQVVISITHNAHEGWTYALPVKANGHFGALVKAPFRGKLSVGIIPHFLTSLNQTSGYHTNAVYTVNNRSTAPSVVDRALFPSALADFNLSPAFRMTAEAIAAHSGNTDTTIAAISNFVSDRMRYDVPAYLKGKILWQDSLMIWRSRIGVCQDYSNLAAAMLRSIGIPTQTVIGTVGGRSAVLFGHNPDDHEWDEAWDGTRWVPFDPTFDSPALGRQVRLPAYLDNEYFTNTTVFQQNHLADVTKIGTDQ